MSVRRILVEKTVVMVGKWDVNKVNDDIVRLIDLDSRDKKGKKIRLQLTTEGLQVARAMFQASQTDDFIPMSSVLNVVVGAYSPQNVMCFIYGVTTAYSVIVYTCSNEYDCAEFVENYKRLRRSVTVDGNSFDLRPIDDGNWTLIRSGNPHSHGTLYVQKNRPMMGQGKIIVAPPQNYESGNVISSKHMESHKRLAVQNGSSTAHSDSGIVTNGTGTTSSERPRTKAKRAKSFKLFDSLKSSSKRDQSPRRERKVKHEKHEKHDKKSTAPDNPKHEVSVVNGGESQATPAGQDMSNALLQENLQQVNEKLRNIELLLEKNGGPGGEEQTSSRAFDKHVGVEDKRYVTTHRQTYHAASDSEAKPSPRARFSSGERVTSKRNTIARGQGHRNGEARRVGSEYRVPVGYVVQRPVRVVHVPQGERGGQHHAHRVRANSSGTEPKGAPSHGVEIHLGPTQSVSSSMTLPRNYGHSSMDSPGTKHVPRVTFDETATDGPSRKNSTRSSGRFANHGPRAADTVVKPIEKVYANPNAYYGHPRTVVIGPGVRQSSNSVRYSSHDRDYVVDDRRNGIPENGL